MNERPKFNRREFLKLAASSACIAGAGFIVNRLQPFDAFVEVVKEKPEGKEHAGDACPMSEGEPPVPKLFSEAELPERLKTAEADPSVVVSRAVRINFGVLHALGKGDELDLNFFPEEEGMVITTIERIEEKKNGTKVMFGVDKKREGWSEIVLLEKGNVLVGLVNTKDRIYRIGYSGEADIHLVQEINISKLPPKGTPLKPPPPDAGIDVQEAGLEAEKTKNETGAETPIVTMAVFYTPAAKAGAGGKEAVEAEIELALELARKAFQDSGVDVGLELTYVGEVNYTESGDILIDLTRFAYPQGESDPEGYMDEVLGIRDQSEVWADEMGLMEEEGDVCGRGWLLTSHYTVEYFANYSFFGFLRKCIPNYTLNHEMDQNLGTIEQEKFGLKGFFDYSHGYAKPGIFYTVGAYPEAGGRRINRISNPRKRVEIEDNRSYVTGTARQDNARTLNHTGFEYGQNYRSGDGPLPEPTETPEPTLSFPIYLSLIMKASPK